MKRFYLNKKEILYWSNKVRKYLKLPKIDININVIDSPCKSTNPCFNKLDISITLPQITKLRSKIFEMLLKKPKTYLKIKLI